MEVPGNEVQGAEYGACAHHAYIHVCQDFASRKMVEICIVWDRAEHVDVALQCQILGPRRASVVEAFHFFDFRQGDWVGADEVGDGDVLGLREREDVGYECASCKGDDCYFELGNRQVLYASSDDLDDEPENLQDCCTFDEGVAFALVGDLLDGYV